MNVAKFLRTTFYTTPPRSRHQRCSMKKGVLRNFTKFTGKHLCHSLIFSKVACIRPATFLPGQRLWRKCFPVNFVKFLEIPFLQNTTGRLLLTSKSSRLPMFFKIGVSEAPLKKLAGSRQATLLKKDSNKGVFL